MAQQHARTLQSVRRRAAWLTAHLNDWLIADDLTAAERQQGYRALVQLANTMVETEVELAEQFLADALRLALSSPNEVAACAD